MDNPQDQAEEQMKLEINKRRFDTDKAIDDTLKNLFRKAKDSLSVEDKAFIQARRSYLTDAQREEYKSVLDEKLPRPDGEGQEEGLIEKTRPELEAMATDLKIDNPEKFKNKQELVDAIEAKQADQK